MIHRFDPRGKDGVPPMYRVAKERPHVWVTDPSRSMVLEVSVLAVLLSSLFWGSDQTR
jgi:hypothetical protein